MDRITRMLTLAVMLALSLLTGNVLAQTEAQKEQFRQERENYFNEQLELTGEEALAFWPVYNDYDHRKVKIVEEEKNTMHYSRENADNLSDKEIGEILEKIQRLRGELARLEQEYYGGKFQEVLPQRKVLKLYWVEWDFRRHLIRQIRGHGQGGRGPRGEGQHPSSPPPARNP